MLKMTPGSDVEHIYSTSLWGVKIYNFLYKEFNICSFTEANINKKDRELKRTISFLVKKENYENEEPQYEMNLPALLILFSKCFSFLLYHKLERKSKISLPFQKNLPPASEAGGLHGPAGPVKGWVVVFHF